MHGRALELLDELIGVVWSQSSWDEKEAFYIEEHAPRISRSDDPEFRWIDQDNERVILKRLRELMPDDEWRILPELILARRSLDLQELESDRDRPARLAAWTAAFARARQEGEVRLAREEEERAAAREAQERERRDRAAEIARRLEDARRAQREREERDRREAEARAARDEAGRATPEAEQGALSLGETDQARRGAEAEPPPDGPQDAASRPRHPMSPHGGGSIANRGRGDPHGEGDGPALSVTTTPPAQEDAMADDSHDADEVEVRLQELAELADEGLISPEEYAEHRERVAGAQAEAEEAMNDATASNDAGEGSDDADDATDPADATAAEEPDEFPAVDDAAADGASDDEQPTDQDTPPDAPVPASESTAATETPPLGSAEGVALSLRGYARRLADRSEQALADAVREYAERVRGVERGELPAVLSVAPAAIAPEMVGAALVRRRPEGFLELVRNVLIFMPVLWTWLKLYFALQAYPSRPLDENWNFFDFWVNEGGSVPFFGFLGGTLADAALQVAVILVLLVALNSLLGMLRGRTERRREREARSFAALLARAEAAGAAHRVEDPQSALAGFAVAATGLTRELRSVGQGLQRSAAPFVEAAEAFADQRRRLDDVIEQLRDIAGMGDQLAALRAEFSGAREAAERSAEALTGIRDSLDPSARDFADAAGTLAQLVEPLQRLTDAMAGTIAVLDSGFDSSAEHLRDAALSMNTVATRVLDELGDGRSAAR